MKDWVKVEADVNKIMNRHYTKGRQGHKIDKIIIHHNGGNLTVDSIWEVWQTRRASAHYQVTRDGTIGQLVWDSDTAWHAGNWQANVTSIGIEHANLTFSPTWTVSDATLDNGAHLVAALCHRFNLGRPQWGVNMFPHQQFTSTDCPGALWGAQKQAYEQRAQYWWDVMAGSLPEASENTTEPASAEPAGGVPASGADVESLARDVIAGKYGNGQARRDTLGTSYEAVQARVNEILAGQNPASEPTESVTQVAHRVMAGDFGNGQDRRRRLAEAGYDYETVQAEVNRLLGYEAREKSVDEIAREVIAGQWGNGKTRKNKLTQAGYDYAEVQARVNQMLA